MRLCAGPVFAPPANPDLLLPRHVREKLRESPAIAQKAVPHPTENNPCVSPDLSPHLVSAHSEGSTPSCLCDDNR